jgi:hypothetical protein
MGNKRMKSNHNTQSDAKKYSLDSTRSRNQVIEEEIKDEPMDAATEDQLISLLHLDNMSGLRGLMKRGLLDFDTFEGYIYCDIIPSETDSTNCCSQSDLEEDNPYC